jgi:hypothetical protein
MMKVGQKLHQAWTNPAWTQATDSKKDDNWVVDAEDADK